MKHIILFIIVLFFIGNCTTPISNNQKSHYYFCTSRTIIEAGNNLVNNILFTDVIQFLGEESAIPSKTSEWAQLVDKNCEASFKCTSDLNYYPSYEEAQNNLNEFIDKYKDNSLYQMKKIGFQ